MAMWLGSQSLALPYVWGFGSSRLVDGSSGASGFLRPSWPGGGRYVLGCTFQGQNMWAWTGSGSGQFLGMFTPSGLRSGAGPQVVITLAGLGSIIRTRFDSGGNAWVQLFGNRTLKINAGDLLSSGSPTPSVELNFTGEAAALDANDLIFDAAGNMYVSFYASGVQSTINKVTPVQYAASNAALVPTARVGGATAGNTRGYTGAAFDGTRMWYGSYNNSRIYAYTLAQLGATAADPAPDATLTFAGFNGCQGIEFDSGGNLWVDNYNDGKLFRIPAAQIAGTGSIAVTPDRTITTGVAPPVYFAFAP